MPPTGRCYCRAASEVGGDVGGVRRARTWPRSISKGEPRGLRLVCPNADAAGRPSGTAEAMRCAEAGADVAGDVVHKRMRSAIGTAGPAVRSVRPVSSAEFLGSTRRNATVELIVAYVRRCPLRPSPSGLRGLRMMDAGLNILLVSRHDRAGTSMHQYLMMLCGGCDKGQKIESPDRTKYRGLY